MRVVLQVAILLMSRLRLDTPENVFIKGMSYGVFSCPRPCGLDGGGG